MNAKIIAKISMNFNQNRSNNIKLSGLIYLFVALFLVSQYLTVQHSTWHSFHSQSDSCLVFQIAESPALIQDFDLFNLIKIVFKDFKAQVYCFLFLTPASAFSPRAPPVFLSKP